MIIINRLYIDRTKKENSFLFLYVSHFYPKFLKELPFVDDDENVIKSYLKNNHSDDLLRFLEYRYFLKKYDTIKIKGRDAIYLNDVNDNLLLENIF